MTAADFLVFVRLLAPAFLLWSAWMVARAPYRERVNGFLVSFLIVLAAGFLLEFGATIFGAEGTVRDTIGFLGSFFGHVDPLLLLATACAAAWPSRALSKLAFLPLMIVGAALFVWSRTSAATSGPLDLAHLAYVNGLYLAGFVILLRAYAAETRPYRSKHLAVLSLGIGFAALSRMAALIWPNMPGWIDPSVRWTTITSYATAAVALSLVVLWLVASRTMQGASLSPIFRKLGLLLVAFFGAWYVLAIFEDLAGSVRLWNMFFSLRWVVFSLVMAHAVLRHQLFDYELHVRNAVRFLASTGFALAVAILVGVLIDGPMGNVLWARLVALLAGFAAFGVAYFVTSLGAGRTEAGTSVPRSDTRRLEIYEATLEMALQRAGSSREDLIYAETLREVFDISPEEHEKVLARVRRNAPGAAPA